MRAGPLFTAESSSKMVGGTGPTTGDDDMITPILKLNEMSMQEREQGLQDLHGVSDLQQENPSFVEESVAGLKMKLKLGSAEHSEDRELIKFLRSENFDTDRAAARYLRFQALQTRLFGKPGKIKYSDLNEQDARFLQSGFMQLLPQRDRAGRAILICISSIKKQLGIPIESEAAEDEETQKRGLVMIYYALARKTYDSRSNRPVQLISAFSDLPARVVSAHLCFDNAMMQPLVTLICHAMESNLLCRFRSHCGKHLECQYTLMTFGIPKECLPIDLKGQVDLTNHRLFLQTFQSEDTSPPIDEAGKFLIPGNLDIIMGRGQHAKNSPGHLRFKHMLEEHKEHYESVGKFQKTVVADLILKKLHVQGCRFLKTRKEGGWVQVSDDVSREKINHAFRNLRSSNRRIKAAAAEKGSKRSFNSFAVEPTPMQAANKAKLIGVDWSA